MTYGTEVFSWVGQEDDLRTDPMIKVNYYNIDIFRTWCRWFIVSNALKLLNYDWKKFYSRR